ncbi:hypothetical protein PVL29_024984 [Vitis rotundifolia]|uniref:Terpene synthase metal-binding domain-containing protein n=1 Tax=Vitis rotundifolia TaxID=103349 RepID=A0AA38YTB7_VITRO|nr:hypothetical protein PVL29_024984 [Vitis rotundifolia]
MFCQMKIQIGAYFDEAQWFHEGNVPTIDKYMQVARVSSSFPLTIVIFFIGMDKIITKEAFEWVYNDPFTIASCLIARLMNDMTSHKCEEMKVNSSFFHMSAMEIKGIICIDGIVIRLE